MIDSLQKLTPWLVALPILPKILLSSVLVLFTAFVLAVIWKSPSTSPSSGFPRSGKLWPEEKDFQALKSRIERISKMNRQILALILDSGRNGIYIDDLIQRTGLSRGEAVYRGQELESLKLVEILELTDKNYRLNEDVQHVIGPGGERALKALLEEENRLLRNKTPSEGNIRKAVAEIVGPSTISVGKRAIYRAEFEGNLEFEWHYTQPGTLTDRNVFIELAYPGQIETLTLTVRTPDGQTFTTSKRITAVVGESNISRKTN